MIDDDEDEVLRPKQPQDPARNALVVPKRRGASRKPGGEYEWRKRVLEAAKVLQDHEVTATDKGARVLVVMRLMTEGRWRKLTSAALAAIWGCSRVVVGSYAAEASRRLRAGDADLLEQRRMLAQSLFQAGFEAAAEPLHARVKLQGDVLKATANMFAQTQIVQLRVDPALEELGPDELRHFAEVSPEDCDVDRCKVHAPETMARLLGRSKGSEGE